MRMIRDASQAYSRFARRLSGALPKGLFARSLIIIIAPIILLQAVVAAVFLERHWAQVTERLSESFVNDVRGLIAIYDTVQPREAARALVVSNGELLGYAAVDFEAVPPCRLRCRPHRSICCIACSWACSQRI